jgi:hypothetical protein
VASVFARQVVDPAPQHEAVVEFDADDRVAADLDVLGGTIAGAAGMQAEQGLRVRRRCGGRYRRGTPRIL